MRFLIDIDGTIARNNDRHFRLLCNKRLKLGIPGERLLTLSFDEFLAQPEVVAYREKHGKQRLDGLLAWLKFDYETLLHLLPIKGARQGVEQCASYGEVAYYTARMVNYTGTDERKAQAIKQLNEKMEQATRTWLKRYRFPYAENVVCCIDGPQGKMAKVSELVQTLTERVVLIDDKYAELKVLLDASSDEALKNRLVLGAFRGETVDDPRMIALYSWKHIDLLLSALEGDLNAVRSR